MAASMPGARGELARLRQAVARAAELQRALQRLARLVTEVGVAGDALEQRIVAVGEGLEELWRVVVGEAERVDQRAVEGDECPSVTRKSRKPSAGERVAEQRHALGVGRRRVQSEQLHPGLHELAVLAALRRPGSYARRT